MSLLLSGPGHDAKKGEKQSNPDDPDDDTDAGSESSRGHKVKEVTTDAAKTLPQQSTHVASTSQVNPDSGKSESRATSDTAVLEQVTHVAEQENKY